MTLVSVDIGGTNIRFATVAEDGALANHRSMLCAEFPSLEAAFSSYLDVEGITISAASVAVAGPVQGDLVDVTNNHWSFSKRALLTGLELQHLLIVNDFTAQALAQTDPAANGNLAILDGKSVASAPLLVIGPGTGLGVSALIPIQSNFQTPSGQSSSNKADYIPIEGEGGHVSYAPQTEDEMRLFTALAAELPFVEVEHLVSGNGLATIYRIITGGEIKPAPEIGAAAIKDRGRERDAANMMLAILGTVIANSVLTMGCWRGVVIAGGIVAQLRPLIEQSDFAARFRHQGTMRDLLVEVPVWLSFDPHAGVRGAAEAFTNPNLKPRILSRA
ncbi:MAG: hypothetical protein GWP36_01560 [Bacteroidetes bacterium]|jgi:glucokinase|nr:hypothetical protein [Bacteroidota bacterium]